MNIVYFKNKFIIFLINFIHIENIFMKLDFFSDEQLRYSASHLLAQAIDELFPGTLFTLAPATETGFFYDILPKIFAFFINFFQ
jgi:threonyl-tRNA synthetase